MWMLVQLCLLTAVGQQQLNSQASNGKGWHTTNLLATLSSTSTSSACRVVRMLQQYVCATNDCSAVLILAK